MTPTSNTPDRLILEDRPWLLWIVLYGMGLGALLSIVAGQTGGAIETLLVATLGLAALWIAWKFEPYQKFTFDRPTGTFTHDITRLTGRKSWTKPLTDIRRAASQGDWDEGERSERVVLLTAGTPYPLESGFTGKNRTPIIEAINDWLGVDKN